MPPSRSIYVECECGHSLSAFRILKRLGKIDAGSPPSVEGIQPLVSKLKCSACGCKGKVTLKIVERKMSRLGPPPRTSINAQKARRTPPAQISSKTPVSPGCCGACSSTIPWERLQAVPGTRYCVSCASLYSSVGKRMVPEPWGSRADWKRDRASWKR